MAVSAKKALAKINGVTHAWSKLRADKTFGGLSLEQYQLAVKPSHDVRSDIAESEVRLQSSHARRVTVDEASLKIVQRVINAIKADPDEGDDGELYVAMGYVRKRDRSTGLTRRKREEKTPEAHAGEPAPKEGAAQ
jgi:hypothetical protein